METDTSEGIVVTIRARKYSISTCGLLKKLVHVSAVLITPLDLLELATNYGGRHCLLKKWIRQGELIYMQAYAFRKYQVPLHIHYPFH